MKEPCDVWKELCILKLFMNNSYCEYPVRVWKMISKRKGVEEHAN